MSTPVGGWQQLSHAIATAVTILSTTIGLAQAEALPQGCWRVDRVVAIRNEVEQPYDFTGCRLWIGDTGITRGCDRTNVRVPQRYAVDREGALRVDVRNDGTGGMPARITRDDEKLTLEIEYHLPGAQPYRDVWRLASHAGDSEMACLPAKRVVSKEQFSEIFQVPTLMVASAELKLRLGLISSTGIVERLRAMPLRAATAPNVRRFLTEFDKLTDDISAPLREMLEKDPAQLSETFFRLFPKHHDADWELGDKDVQRWAHETSGRLLEVARVAPYLVITGMMDPENDQGRAWANGAISVKQVDTKLGLGETFATFRNSLHTKQLEQYPDGFLPVSRDSLIALRQWSESEVDRAKQWERRTVHKIDFSAAISSVTPPPVTREQNARLELLLARFDATLDPRTMGRCTAAGLDIKTVDASRGDWRVVRTESGAPIRAGSMAHVAMLNYLRAGCGPQKDFARLRTMMDEITSVERGPEDDDRIEFMRGQLLCNLARWARNGIGGERSEDAARRYEQMYRMRIYKLDHEPTDTEKGALAQRFPSGAAEGFSCLRPNQNGSRLQRAYSIDPRDPWATLQ